MPRISLIHKEYGEIDFQYSPERIEYSSQGGWVKKTIYGNDDPLIKWAGGSGFSISLEALFTGKNGVEQADKLIGAVRANPWTTKAGKPALTPPIWTLYIGQKFYTVVVDDVQRTDSMFNGKKTGLATIRISMTKYRKYAVSAQ